MGMKIAALILLVLVLCMILAITHIQLYKMVKTNFLYTPKKAQSPENEIDILKNEIEDLKQRVEKLESNH